MINPDLYWSLPLTICVYFIMRKICSHYKKAIFNPLLFSLITIIPILLIFDIPYERYFRGSLPIHELLQIGVVALSFPLYKQLPDIIKRWKILISICCIASTIAMISGVAIAMIMGADKTIAASILPKSVTTPIALVVTREVGGIEAIAAVCVLFVGIMGAIFGHGLLNLFHIKSKSARGMAMGAVSHVIGTARCNDVDQEEGAFSSLALILCGVFTALSAPTIFNLIMKWWNL